MNNFEWYVNRGSAVIPTLNEEQNIGTVTRKLCERGLEPVVVDADSSDGTRQEARDNGAKVINKKRKNDLSRSVLTGIQEASNDKIVVMDGDRQHPVNPVDDFLELLELNSLVVGYREKVEGEWPRHRRFISKGADIMARAAFRQCQEIKDPISGFFGFRRNHFDFSRFRPRGYKIILEFLVNNEGPVAEVGYSFRNRVNGSSSIGLDDIFNYKLHIADLKYRELKDTSAV